MPDTVPGTGVGPPSRLDNPWLGGGESADQPGTIVVAVVDCIEVVGTSAVIGGNTFRTGGVTFTDPWNVWLVDNGPPGGPNPDLISPFTFDPDEPPSILPCASTVSTAGYFPVTSGNIRVTDGTLAGP